MGVLLNKACVREVVFVFVCLGLHLQHMEVPRLGGVGGDGWAVVQSELLNASPTLQAQQHQI